MTQPPIRGIAALAVLALAACGNDRRATSGDRPTAGSALPAAGGDPLVAGKSPPAAGSNPPAAGSNPPAAGSDPPATGSGAPAAGDLCQRAVGHLLDLMNVENSTHGTKPGPEEQHAIDVEIRQKMIALCQREGLTQAQLDCLLAVHDWDQVAQLGACAAIKDRRPSWLSIP